MDNESDIEEGLSAECILVDVDWGVLVGDGIGVLVSEVLVEGDDLVEEAKGVLVREANGVLVGEADGVLVGDADRDLVMEADEVLVGILTGTSSLPQLLWGW